jgi:hypothetical protein
MELPAYVKSPLTETEGYVVSGGSASPVAVSLMMIGVAKTAAGAHKARTIERATKKRRESIRLPPRKALLDI